METKRLTFNITVVVDVDQYDKGLTDVHALDEVIGRIKAFRYNDMEIVEAFDPRDTRSERLPPPSARK